MENQKFKFDESFLDKYRGKQPDWSPMAYVVFKRTYARTLENGETEEWWQTIARCIEGAQEIGAGYTKEEAEELFDLMFNRKCVFGGRMLWQLGTRTVRKYGGASLLNCWFSNMNTIEDFCFVFENMMLGGGVGFSIRREDIHDFPRVKEGVIITHINSKDADFIVPDSREGWVSLIRKVLEAYFNGGKSFTYSTVLVRPFGEKITGFGGVASGPQILVDGVANMCKVLRNREGKKLRSVDVLDINNILGSIVVAGNVRRAAEIALGDPDDIAFIRAKRWDLGNIPNWRSMSNNSIYADSFDHILPQIWQGYQGNGEPYGFINLPLSQKYGRLKDGLMRNSDIYPTSMDNCQGTNPCAEITLADGESCNLSEIFLNRISSKEELARCAQLLYKTQKCVWTLPFAYEKTQKIVSKNFRIGVGVTGICQSLDKIPWLDYAYLELRKFDKKWSKERGWPESIKLTTTKPSGTLSIVGDSTPGIHPAFAKYFIRRVRISSTDPMVEACKRAGLSIDYNLRNDGSVDRNTAIIEFPCQFGENAVLAKEVSAIEQLELVKRIQTEWSDNAVSVTVYYKKEELEDIKDWLEKNYNNGVKSVSFLLHNDHGFVQAPYEEITEDNYNKIISRIDMNSLYKSIEDNSALLIEDCDSGSCPVR